MLTNPKILHAHSVNLPSKSRFAVHKRAAVIPQSSRASNPRTQKLRDLLQEKYILKGPCCHDALSAKLIEQAGFDFAFMSGFCTSAARLGAPDTGLISYAEMVDQGRYIHEATHSMPIIGDGDTGYGNAVNVKRTVKGYAQAGFAGILIEDQIMPKSCGHVKGKRVTSREEAVSRIKAAVDAREEGADILILARTDARQAISLDEALWRAAAFADAGADLLFIDALQSEEEMRAFCSLPGAAGRVPKMANMLEGGGKTPILSPEQLQQLGFKLVAYPLSLLGVSIRAMQQALGSLQTGQIPAEKEMGSFQDIQKAVGFDEYFEQEAKYALPGSPGSFASPAETGTPHTCSAAAASGAVASTGTGQKDNADVQNVQKEEGEKKKDDSSGSRAGSVYSYSRPPSGREVAGGWDKRPQEPQPQQQQEQNKGEQELAQQQQQQQREQQAQSVEADAVIEEPSAIVESGTRLPTSSRAGEDAGGDSSRTNLFGRNFLVRISDETTRVIKLETRIPAAFLSGLTALVPNVSGLNLESMIERALRDRTLGSKEALVSVDAGSNNRLEVFLE
uniref:Isocitrate lyase n=1 Tax=Dunaliella tertiolecta TaxID=3047 RepID=A0A7S3QYG1_DUNTE